MLGYTANIVPSYYFNKRRALASGLTMAGSSIGTFIMSPVMAMAMEEYGWRSSCFIQAAIVVQLMVFPAYIWPPRKQTPKSSSTPDQPNQPAQKETTQCHDNPAFGKDVEVCTEKPEHKRDTSSDSTVSLTKTDSFTERRKITLSKVKRLARESFDVRLLRDERFVGYGLLLMFGQMGAITAYFFIPKQGIWHGLSKSEASLLLSASAAASLVSRILSGYLFDFEMIRRNRNIIFPIFAIVNGMTVFLSFHPSLAMQMTFAILFGLSFGN